MNNLNFNFLDLNGNRLSMAFLREQRNSTLSPENFLSLVRSEYDGAELSAETKENLVEWFLSDSDYDMLDEDGNDIEIEFLLEMKEISMDESDFLNKVRYGCTNEQSRLDIHTEQNLISWFKNQDN